MSELRLCPFCGHAIDDHADDCFLLLFATVLVDSLMLGNAGMYASVSKEAMRTAWNTRAERTCHVVIEDECPTCSECGEDIDPSFFACPYCGAKVVRP